MNDIKSVFREREHKPVQIESKANTDGGSESGSIISDNSSVYSTASTFLDSISSIFSIRSSATQKT